MPLVCRFATLCTAPLLGPGHAARNHMSSNSLNSFSRLPYLLSRAGPLPAGLFMWPRPVSLTQRAPNTPASLSDIIKLEIGSGCIRGPSGSTTSVIPRLHCLTVCRYCHIEREKICFVSLAWELYPNIVTNPIWKYLAGAETVKPFEWKCGNRMVLSLLFL